MIEKSDRFQNKSIKEKKEQRAKEKKALQYNLAHNVVSTWDIYSRDKDFKELRKSFDK
jgi:choline-glycine betaine transporter